ncbi:uncharacterized protein BX663DRAFT_560474 [Cokeromyces recurvatus]|uniref:uncharacterized protein n=1 Tax=Cokeromyces recurvatus TaxID=90255 RepID=UPI00221FB3A3|nr:uncharacterized protein BX663DRAFT_560474 [Cokeromyces recurvatus]KAI7903477.1 hypothetical protein BX663DRAFT_560474 [Cokeromyces recurvatus]
MTANFVKEEATKSLYDCIPQLDIWYKNNSPIEKETTLLCRKNRKTLASVSFSNVPPTVYCYEDKKLERPKHKRSRSSEQVKEFFNKLSRKLSNGSASNRLTTRC